MSRPSNKREIKKWETLDSRLLLDHVIKIILFVTPTFKPVDRILSRCYHLNKTFLAELLHSDVYF